MDKYSRVVSVSGREFHTSETMGDIFVAHASDIIARGEMELVPLVHEGGVEKLLIGPQTRFTIADAPLPAVPDITGPVTALTSSAA